MGCNQPLSASEVKNQGIPESVSNRLRELLDGEFADHVLSKGEIVAVAKELLQESQSQPLGEG